MTFETREKARAMATVQKNVNYVSRRMSMLYRIVSTRLTGHVTLVSRYSITSLAPLRLSDINTENHKHETNEIGNRDVYDTPHRRHNRTYALYNRGTSTFSICTPPHDKDGMPRAVLCSQTARMTHCVGSWAILLRAESVK